MELLFSGLAAGTAAVLLLPTVSDLLSLARAAVRRRVVRPPPASDSVPPRLLFLVPAHDEELLIRSCVESLRRLRYPAHRFTIVVIADNCRDRTAALVAAAGARCLERHDPQAAGKPRAIVWALTQLPVAEYDALVIVDADTVVDEWFAAALASTAPLNHKAVQAYIDVGNPNEGPLTRMATVLAAAIHRFAYPLKSRVGLNAPLVGNGMCIGTAVLATHGWRAFSICEDWELYALYTAAGVPIESLPQARLYAQEAASLRQSSTQRQRWTAGKLTVLGRSALPLATSPKIGLHQKLDALAELCAQGPVVHLGIVVVLSAILLLLRPVSAGTLLLTLGISLVRPMVYTSAGLLVQPAPLRSALAFLSLPWYAVWRLGAAVATLGMLGDKPWIRTQRHQYSPPAGSKERLPT